MRPVSGAAALKAVEKPDMGMLAMSCGFEIDAQRKLIRLWGLDSLDLDQVVETLKAVHAHADFDPRHQTLCDLRELAEFAFQPDDLIGLVNELKTWDQRTGRTALLVGENRAHRNLTETFERLADGALKAPHQVFFNVVEAEVWLGLRDVMAALRPV